LYDSPGIHSIQAADAVAAPARITTEVIMREDHLRMRYGSGQDDYEEHNSI
jgi:hypothetical protein